MELPRYRRGEELLPAGSLIRLRQRLRRLSARSALTTVIACAFDHRTRMLPFLLADLRMAPAGVRGLGAELLDAGFTRTRIVLQQWNRAYRPSAGRLDGRLPDLLLISSMQIHHPRAMALVGDAWRIDPSHRPLILVGGPKYIYEPWDAFATSDQPVGADVAVTGEGYVMLALLERLLEDRASTEPLRETFYRMRDAGMLDDIPGLVYGLGDDRAGRPPEELVDTGVQQLVGDLDELADPLLGYSILEPPSQRTGLVAQPLAARYVKYVSPISSVVLTLGCRLNCPYCPIPAYNQRQQRTKSAARIADDLDRLNRRYRLQYFFGADDNFFNDPPRAQALLAELVRRADARQCGLRRIRLTTEATVGDTLAMREHLPLARRAGLRALWLGVEDMSGSLVRKGQSVDRTTEAFGLLIEAGILPMPMLMHHDDQPLYTRRDDSGLINQVRLLRRSGAMNMQVMMLSPAPGSRLYERTYRSGMVYASAGGRAVEPHMIDGNYVVASAHRRPALRQMNLLLAYLYFFNPLRLLWSLVRPMARIDMGEAWPDQPRRRIDYRLKGKLRSHLIDAAMQVYGIAGLAYSLLRTFPWAMRLTGVLVRRTQPPTSRIPMRSPGGGRAAHSLDDTPPARSIPVNAPRAASTADVCRSGSAAVRNTEPGRVQTHRPTGTALHGAAPQEHTPGPAARRVSDYE